MIQYYGHITFFYTSNQLWVDMGQLLLVGLSRLPGKTWIKQYYCIILLPNLGWNKWHQLCLSRYDNLLLISSFWTLILAFKYVVVSVWLVCFEGVVKSSNVDAIIISRVTLVTSVGVIPSSVSSYPNLYWLIVVFIKYIELKQLFSFERCAYLCSILFCLLTCWKMWGAVKK